jgi:beta-lactam-binding protein with PASTA domain
MKRVPALVVAAAVITGCSHPVPSMPAGTTAVVPDVVHTYYATAVERLNAAGFGRFKVQKHSGGALGPAGTVVATIPPAGSRVLVTTVIVLVMPRDR